MKDKHIKYNRDFFFVFIYLFISYLFMLLYLFYIYNFIKKICIYLSSLVNYFFLDIFIHIFIYKVTFLFIYHITHLSTAE